MTASRAGLTTAALFFVGGSPQHPGQTADYTIGYGISDAYSRQESVSLEPLAEAWDVNPPASYSPPYEGAYDIPEVSNIYLYVLDSSDDGTANYDTVLLNTARSLDENAVQLRVGEWGQMVLLPRINAGAEFLIQEISPGQAPDQITLYHTGVYHNSAAPRELLDALNQEFGFFPSGADYYALEHGWITPEQNLRLLERASLWMAEVTAWVYQAYQPDLLFTWQDGFDTAGHSFSMNDPRQINYSPENLTSYQGFYRQAIQISDQALGVILKAIDLKHTNLLMVADHGMASIHTSVFVNTVLEQAGMLTLDSQDYVVVAETQAFAVASGGAANVYINLAGHEKSGTVTQEGYPQIQAQIVELLDSLVDPHSGEKVFQRVLRQDELAALHLDHLNSGDVFAQANPGYVLDGWRGNDAVFEQADYYGQHGYDSSLPEMHAMFIAAGASIPRLKQPIPPVRIVDYAPTIAALLGFAPAESVDGGPIPPIVP